MKDDLITITLMIYQLEHVAVLEETLLGNVRFLELNAQIQVLEHNGFDDLLGPSVRKFLVTEHFLQCVQSPGGLPDIDEF